MVCYKRKKRFKKGLNGKKSVPKDTDSDLFLQDWMLSSHDTSFNKNACMCFRNEKISLQVGIFSHSMLSMCLNALLHEVHHDVSLKAPFGTELILDTLF